MTVAKASGRKENSRIKVYLKYSCWVLHPASSLYQVGSYLRRRQGLYKHSSLHTVLYQHKFREVEKCRLSNLAYTACLGLESLDYLCLLALTHSDYRPRQTSSKSPEITRRLSLHASIKMDKRSAYPRSKISHSVRRQVMAIVHSPFSTSGYMRMQES